jgi:Flp pilus assembly protein CpaB
MLKKNKETGHFGAVNTSSKYLKTLEWSTKLLTFAVIVLSFSMIYIVSRSDLFKSNEKQTMPVVVREPVTTDILVAKMRIEEGARISDDLVSIVAVPNEVVPAGAIKAVNKEMYVGQYAKNLVNAGFPLRSDDFDAYNKDAAFRIPVGQRAVSITVDARSRVEGFAKPNSRVDVLWFYSDKNSGENVATIVRFAKVLSVGGVTGEEEETVNNVAKAVQDRLKQTTLTLLVSEEEARIIELARNMGTLSLSLVGQEEPFEEATYADSVNVREVMKRVRTMASGGVSSDGALTMYDPKLGKEVKLVLSNNRWVSEAEFNAQNETETKPISTFKSTRARLREPESITGTKDEI